MSETPLHILIVSNRGPFSFSIRDGQPHAVRGSGGLVTAITAIARQHDVLWISCALSKGDREWLKLRGDGIHHVEDMSLRLIQPDPEQYHAYYNIVSNPLLWFVQHQLHDTPRLPLFDEHLWNAWADGYSAVNRQFAETVADSIKTLDGRILVLVQDYHLYLFPRFLRELIGDRAVIQSFLHIPWPSPDAWRVLPLKVRRELVDAMLHADRIGFQTERDTRRFLQTCVDLLPGVRVLKPWRRLAYQGRNIDAVPYPISIAVSDIEQRAESAAVQQQIALFQQQYAGVKLILRVDRVDPSKNILRGLIALRNFLLVYPEYRGKVVMLMLLVPSRPEISEYRSYLRDIMALVGEINATLSDGGWEPIRVLLGNNYDRAIAAFRLYDVLLVNPLADGMNLVAKEGVILNRKDGVLVLSEEAGVAEEFGSSALLVSPYDVLGTRQAIRAALDMSPEERRERANRLREQVRHNDINHWFARQLADAEQQWKQADGQS
jgi:trehalose 6-phosphate synthase